MKYRLPFVFSCERFENALICIISRFRPILNFSIFRKNGTLLELLNIVMVFENTVFCGIFFSLNIHIVYTLFLFLKVRIIGLLRSDRCS